MASWRRVGNLRVMSWNKDHGGVKERHAAVYRVAGEAPGEEGLTEVAEAYFYTATHLGATLTIDGMEHRYEAHLGLPGLTLGLRGGKPRYPSREREYGLRLHNWRLSLYGGRDPNASSREDPWWREQSVNLKRLIFGKVRYESMPVVSVLTVVEMPEGNYPARVTISDDRWTYPRALLGRLISRRAIGAEITPEVPIPLPGKGENSWDLDDDALRGLYTSLRDGLSPAETFSPLGLTREATRATRDSVMRDREKYGSGDPGEWVPAAGWPQGIEARAGGGGNG
jgi:hypothetical protein